MDTVSGSGGGSIGTTYYYAEDFLGSSRAMVQAGATSACFDADFLPFGRENDAVTTCNVNSYKFEGKERDAETGNDDFGARYYSSNFGRWLSPDWSSTPAPVPYANLANPQTLNLYAMVEDDPESFADLDGHVISGDPRNGYCNVVSQTGCNEEDLGYIFKAHSWGIFEPQEVARFVNLIGQLDDPYAYDPATFDPHNAKDISKAQAQQAQSESPQTADAFPLTLPAAAASAGASSGLLEFLITASAALRVGGVVVGVGDFFFNAPATAPASVDQLSPTILKEEAERAKENERNPAQDKLLSDGEIKKLKGAGYDVHDLKPGAGTDLYKDKAGNIYVKPKGGAGAGDPTGININDY